MSRALTCSIATLAAVSLILAACETTGVASSPPVKSVAVSAQTMAALGTPVEKGRLRPASTFMSIGDTDQRAAAIFTEMGKVLTHPRCVNCHPVTDKPLQGDQQMPHSPMVTRGPEGHGDVGLECSTCHGPRNVAFANGTGSIPGNPKWALAPIEMAWQGKTIGQICQQLRDPKRSHKTLEELHHHNAEDILVGYGWNPGVGREPAPGTQKEFGDLTRAWIDAGAACPSTIR